MKIEDIEKLCSLRKPDVYADIRDWVLDIYPYLPKLIAVANAARLTVWADADGAGYNLHANLAKSLEELERE